jgi:hypothetical protein
MRPSSPVNERFRRFEIGGREALGEAIIDRREEQIASLLPILSQRKAREGWPMRKLDSMRDGTHCRERASEARATADACDHPDEKRMMLDIARSYDILAESAEKRFAENKPILM